MIPVTPLIKQRKSVRSYKPQTIERDKLDCILQAGISAPSGKNGQPWRFIVVQQDKQLIKELAALTLYESFVKTADVLIAVFMDKRVSYNYIKDCQAIGACIQNMLLQASELDIATCWIGEILNRDIFVKRLLNVDNSFDLMAVITMGYADKQTRQPFKSELDKMVLNRR